MTQFFVFWVFRCFIFFMAFLSIAEKKKADQVDDEEEKKVEVGVQDFGLYDWEFVPISLSDSLWSFGENLLVDFITDDKEQERMYTFDLCFAAQQNCMFLGDRFVALMPCRTIGAREASFIAHREAIAKTSSV